MDLVSRSATEPIIYRIDAEDRISYVNWSWEDSAMHSGTPDVLPDRVLGRRLWDFVSEPTTRAIYQRLVARAREGTATTIHYRCDRPDRHRIYAMTIGRLATGEIEFSTRILRESRRPRIALLEQRLRAPSKFVRICDWCQDILLFDRGWVPLETAAETLERRSSDSLPGLVHSICERCEDRVSREIAQPSAAIDLS